MSEITIKDDNSLHETFQGLSEEGKLAPIKCLRLLRPRWIYCLTWSFLVSLASLQLMVETALEGVQPQVNLSLLQLVRGVEDVVAGGTDALSAGLRLKLLL